MLARLRAVVEAKAAENALLRRELDAERELRRQLELRLAELERGLSMDSHREQLVRRWRRFQYLWWLDDSVQFHLRP